MSPEEELYRCYLAARNLAMQCKAYPLWMWPEECPPTYRWGTASEITMKMMEAM